VSGVSLSTMWMQHRFHHVRPFAAEARTLGFDAIELSHIVTPEMVEGLQPGDVAVSSLHYPAPTVRHSSGAIGDRLLASLHEDERRWAVEQGSRTIECAARLGADAVCVHLGRVEMDVHHCWALEQRFLAGQAGSAVYAALVQQIATERQERQGPHLDAARRSLRALAQRGQALGVRLGLENRRHPYEIPSPDELRVLLADVDPNVVGLWYDTGHAHALAKLGFWPERRWLADLAARTVGVHIHDAVGTRDHLVPGIGDIDFASIAAELPPEALRVCEFDWYYSPQEVELGRAALRRHGWFTSSFD
jgi:sugar phosphate isomerase/epimerase